MRDSKMNSWLQSSFVVFLLLIGAVSAARFQTFSILPSQLQRLDFGNHFFTAASPNNCEQERTNCINKCTEENMLFRCSSFTGLASTCTCTSPPSISPPSVKNESLRCKSSRWQCEQTCGPNPNFQCTDSGSAISQSCSCTHELSENSNSNAFAHSKAVSKPLLIDENIVKSKNNSTSGTFSSAEAVAQVNGTVVDTASVPISSVGTNKSKDINVDLSQQEDGVIDVIEAIDVNNTTINSNSTVSSNDKSNQKDIDKSIDKDTVVKYDNQNASSTVAITTATAPTVQSSNKTEEIIETTVSKSVQKNKQKEDEDDDEEGDDDDSDEDEDEEEEEEEKGEGDDDDDDEEGGDDDEEEEGGDDDEEEEGDGDNDDEEEEESNQQSSTKNSTLGAECKKAKANCQTKCKNMEIDSDCQANGGAFTQSCTCVSKNERLSPSPFTSKPKSPTPTPTPTQKSNAKSPTPTPIPATEAISTGRSSLTPKSINQTSANVIVSASVVPSITDIDAVNTTLEVTDMHAQNVTLETSQIVLSNFSSPIQEPTFLIDVLSFTDQQSLECQLAAENCRLMCGDMVPKFECGQILNVVSQNCSCSSASVLTKSDTAQSTTYSTLNSNALNVTNSTKNVQNVENAAGVVSKSTATGTISTTNSTENVQNTSNVQYAHNVASKSTATGTISTTYSSENVQNAANVASNGTTHTAIRTIDTSVEVADEPLNEYSVNNIFSGKNQVNNNLLNSNNTVIKSSLSKKVVMEPECEQAKKECENMCGEMEIQFDCEKVGINFAKSCACVSKNVNVSDIDAFSGAHANLSESMKTRMQEILKMQNEP